MARILLDELMKKQDDFVFAINGRLLNDAGEIIKLTPKEARFVEDAISSIDYVVSILTGQLKMPSAYDDVNSPAGQVFGYLQGSMLNITMAENILYKKWGNVNALYECEGNANTDEDGYDTSCFDDDKHDDGTTASEDEDSGWFGGMLSGEGKSKHHDASMDSDEDAASWFMSILNVPASSENNMDDFGCNDTSATKTEAAETVNDDAYDESEDDSMYMCM